LFFDLQWLVVGELDDCWFSLEERLVHINLRVGVDAVVCDVEVLDDLGPRELVYDAATRLLVLHQLAW
jgi:hypothetical protein